MTRLRVLPRRFYNRDPLDVARDLLGKVIVRGRRRARIVEVEAYRGAIDPGSHAYRGRTKRNATMFGRPGLLYVYFTYGMHWCANAVCGPEGDGLAVLLRAAEPLTGIDEMVAARGLSGGARVDGRAGVDLRLLCSGPARLAQAFGVDGSFDGADLVTRSHGLWIGDDGSAPPAEPAVTLRVGLGAGKGDDLPWRFTIPDHPHVSR